MWKSNQKSPLTANRPPSMPIVSSHFARSDLVSLDVSRRRRLRESMSRTSAQADTSSVEAQSVSQGEVRICCIKIYSKLKSALERTRTYKGNMRSSGRYINIYRRSIHNIEPRPPTIWYNSTGGAAIPGSLSTAKRLWLMSALSGLR